MCTERCNNCFSRWRIWIRPLLIVCYTLFAIIVVPLLIVNSVKDGFTRKDQLILIGGLFVLTALPISFWHITQHMINYTKPILQKHIVRILWMVPIYALNALLGLLFPAHVIYMDSIRECYEAYVIYNFMVYLLNYLNLEMDLEANMQLKPSVKHLFPLCWMRPWEMGTEFIHNCKHGILQYTVIRPITTFVSVACELGGVYGEGLFSANVAYPYILVVNNLSQFCAMYCLVLFYQANKVELQPMRPLPKFLCIKAVVFFSFFQGVIINFLVYFGVISNIFGSDEHDSYQDLSAKLQNFLICIEMFLAAIAHQYSFPHDPFHINIPHFNSDRNWMTAITSMLDFSDVQQDVSEHLGVVGSSLSRRLRGRTSYQMARGTTEHDYLISTGVNPPEGPSTTYYQSGMRNVANITSISSTTGHGQKQGYGAIDSTFAKPIAQPTKPTSPHRGAPGNDNPFNDASENLLTVSSRTNSKSDTSSTNVGGIPKSDSGASDWLSTPTEEFAGIDIKGLENDRIHLNE
ncbi:transmembrane protein 184C [Phlebotomus argentipes]|uniref:transmembrane protein 184C n=1 Tax=Phlebotomus argentipes TaxID=94469 RepID=UPI002892AABF|nr:transmembrane protein 184C [Phlebotomus argentipes]